MNSQNENPHSGYEKTEQIVNMVGTHVGHWAGRVFQRMQRAAGALNEEADRMDAPQAESESGEQQAGSSTVKRAEDLMGKAGDYLKHFTTGNAPLRRTLARLKEDVEDMWADARNVEHHGQTRPHNEPPQDEAH